MQVSAAVPKVPSWWNVLRSVCAPAPPVASDPAMARATWVMVAFREEVVPGLRGPWRAPGPGVRALPGSRVAAGRAVMTGAGRTGPVAADLPRAPRDVRSGPVAAAGLPG
ncbi:hypothetical protein GCM10028787_29380 [Brachybacterium horti]